MSAYKDKTQGTWYVSFRYIDWTGKKTQKLKRGFKTKKEALNYEKEFIRKTAADMKMEMNSFIQVYFEDKKNELKENSIRNKQHMMNKHIVPYFGTRKMNEITPAEIIQWQNTIQEKGYSKTYERMIDPDSLDHYLFADIAHLRDCAVSIESYPVRKGAFSL
nr:Arm DNA-binding domain-containing protein [uncultured Blautia sp.]